MLNQLKKCVATTLIIAMTLSNVGVNVLASSIDSVNNNVVAATVTSKENSIYYKYKSKSSMLLMKNDESENTSVETNASTTLDESETTTTEKVTTSEKINENAGPEKIEPAENEAGENSLEPEEDPTEPEENI